MLERDKGGTGTGGLNGNEGEERIKEEMWPRTTNIKGVFKSHMEPTTKEAS